MHDRTRSANLPKLAALLQKAHAHSGFKHMEEPRSQMLQMLPWPSASVLHCI